jgi:hypothetical protein
MKEIKLRTKRILKNGSRNWASTVPTSQQSQSKWTGMPPISHPKAIRKPTPRFAKPCRSCLKHCEPSHHQGRPTLSEFSKPTWDVPLLFQWINGRQEKRKFFLEPGIANKKTSNRTVAIRRVVSTLIFEDYGSVLNENASLRLEIAEVRRALEEMPVEALRPTKLFGEEENHIRGRTLVPATASIKKKSNRPAGRRTPLVPLTASTKKKFAGRSHSTPPKSSKKAGRAPKTPAPKSYNADELAKVMGSIQLANKVGTQNIFIGGVAAPPPPAESSSEDDSSSSSSPSSQDTSGS